MTERIFMNRSLAFTCLVALFLQLSPAADEPNPQAAKEALQALNDFIGTWKGSGGPDKPRPEPKETWSETVTWSWRFKGDDAWLTVTIKNGKHIQSGELRYLPAQKRYQLTAVTKDGKKLIFEGELKEDVLTLDRIDKDKKETQRLRINLAAEGVRLIYRYERKPEGRTLFVRDYQVACTKEGESLGAQEKKIACVVSGGLVKIPVGFKGVTYYVCCSGCRDAFNENPEKYIKEFEAKKGK
jgi:hypothetical protein